MSKGIEGWVVAVTGGVRGIGRATAQALLDEGASVAIGDLDRDEAQAAADELGPAAVGIGLDVTDRASFASFLDAAEDALGPLDGLVNNAGIMLLGDFLKEDDESADRQIDVNVRGVLLGMKLAGGRMAERNHGHIVNIASAAGKTGFPGAVSYCATKHAVVGATEALRTELAASGVQLTAIMPAVVETELASGLGKAAGIRPLAPEEVADAVVKALGGARAEITLPSVLGVLQAVMAPLPAGLRARISHVLGGDRVLTGASSAERSTYETRARGG
jgi:NADP-dependent 3-hydroxy acid dehydrogenase YdfG